jgi:hypothetical protein
MSSNSLPRLVPIGSSGLRARTATAAFALGASGYAAGVGYLALHDRRLAIGAAVIGLLAGVVADNLARLAIVATAGVWLIQRVPGNVSVTDVLVAVAGLAAALSGAGEAVHLRGRLVLRSFTFYLATLSVTLAFNHSLRSDFEWFHRIALVAGAICAGAWLVQAGVDRTALRWALGISVCFATLAFAEGIGRGFTGAVQPLGYQKNFIGSICATILITLIVAPHRFDLPPRLSRFAVFLLVGGLVATHSRGAMVALTVGVLIWFFKGSPGANRRLRAAAIVAAIGVSIFTAISVAGELDQGNSGRHTSLTVRSEVEKQTRELWIHHPWTGVGLRFFKTPRYAGYQAPNNVIDEVAAEAGVFGVFGFLIFVGGALIGLGRLQGDLATAGLCVVAARFTHGLFDIYWTGGTTALPWIIAGMGLASAGVLARQGWIRNSLTD